MTEDRAEKAADDEVDQEVADQAAEVVAESQDPVGEAEENTSDAAEDASEAATIDAVFGDDGSEDVVVEATLDDKLQDAENRALRAQAELENFRKRTQREMEQNRKYAAVAVIRELLTVIDNLHLAIRASDDSEASSALVQGVTMVAEQFESVLKQHNCERIKDLGEPFDPNFHEAMAQEPSEEYPAGSISRVTRTGYQIHDRVVRPSQVFVSTGPPEPPAEPTEEQP